LIGRLPSRDATIRNSKIRGGLPHDKKVFAYQCVNEDHQALPDSETDTNIVFNPVTPRQTDAHVDKNVAFNVSIIEVSEAGICLF
jgi:hypothetical protein